MKAELGRSHRRSSSPFVSFETEFETDDSGIFTAPERKREENDTIARNVYNLRQFD